MVFLTQSLYLLWQIVCQLAATANNMKSLAIS